MRDITYIRALEGFAYLAIVIDLYSSRAVGWSVQSRQTTDVVVQALHMAVWRRKLKHQVLIHSDRGSQGGLNRLSRHHRNWRLRWAFAGKGQIDVDDRLCDHLSAPLLWAATSGSCSGRALPKGMSSEAAGIKAGI